MNKYILLCDYCGWKVISDFKKTNIYELKNDTLSNKKYRCEKCGRGVCLRKFQDPQSELDKKIQEDKIKKETEEWIIKNMDYRKNFLKDIEIENE
jgi:ribosomal protein S27AE